LAELEAENESLEKKVEYWREMYSRCARQRSMMIEELKERHGSK
jgi:hypothetical protein